MGTFIDVALDTGLVGGEDITEFMQNTLTSPTSTTRTGAGHRKQLAFRIDTAPTLDNLTPFERYIAFGFEGSSETWAKNASLKAAPLTVRVGTTGSPVSNPPSGFYRLRWNHNAADFDTTYQDPSRYDLYVEPGPSVGMRAVTHTPDGELVPINGAFLAAVSATGDGRSLANGGTIVTVTTEAEHGLDIGDVVALGSIAYPVLTAGVTGVWTLTGVTATTLTFATAADGETAIDLGPDLQYPEMYACPRLVNTSANDVFVRLQIDGRTAIAFVMPKPATFGYLDIIAEQTNRLFGATGPKINLLIRHAVPPDTASLQYTTFTVPGDIDNGMVVDLEVGARCLPGSRIRIVENIVVENGVATFKTQAKLIESEAETELFASWRANFPEGGAPYNSAAYTRWLNHRLVIPGGQVFVDNASTSYFNGTWTVKTSGDWYTSEFTVDVADLNLADGSYAVGSGCFVYPARVSFNRVTDGLRFFMDTDAEFSTKFSTLAIPPNARRVYIFAPRGHDLSVGSTVFFEGAFDKRLDGIDILGGGPASTFVITECPALDPLWYAPVVVGLGRDHWAAFDLTFTPTSPIETMTGPDIVMYTARLESPVQYATLDAFSNVAAGSDASKMMVRTSEGVNTVTFASKSDAVVLVDITGPSVDDGHTQQGYGSQGIMDVNILYGELQFTDFGMARAIYTVGDFNKTLAVTGRWSLSQLPTSQPTMHFGIDWLGEYAIECVKSDSMFDLYATRSSFGTGATQEEAQISTQTVVLVGNIIGETMPLQIADVIATPEPRLTLSFQQNFLKRRLNIDVLLEGGSVISNVFTRSVMHATRIELSIGGEEVYARGSTVEFFSNGFTTLANIHITGEQFRDTPVFSNVVYLGSSHNVTEEEDRSDVLIASLGPNRLIRANLNTFRIFSSTLSVGNVSFGPGASTFGSIAQITQAKSSATGVVEHDYAVSSVFYHSSLSANFTCAVANVPSTNDRSLPLTLVLAQGPTPYMANALEINDEATAISWLNNTVPTGNASKTNLVSFAMFRAGNAWTVLAKSEVFG